MADLIRRGRRIRVVRVGFRRSAARNMARAGWPVWAICLALGARRGAVEKALAVNGIWGGLLEEFRRAA